MIYNNLDHSSCWDEYERGQQLKGWNKICLEWQIVMDYAVDEVRSKKSGEILMQKILRLDAKQSLVNTP